MIWVKSSNLIMGSMTLFSTKAKKYVFRMCSKMCFECAQKCVKKIQHKFS